MLEVGTDYVSHKIYINLKAEGQMRWQNTAQFLGQLQNVYKTF